MSEADLFHLPPDPIKPTKSKMAGTGIPLRWCQADDCDMLEAVLQRGYKRPANIAATGYGKGPIIAEMAGRLLRSLGTGVVLVNRSFLVHQLSAEIERHLGIPVGRVADSSWEGIHRSIVVATVQGMYTPTRDGRCLYEYEQFKDRRWVQPDEAHLFYSPVFYAPIQHWVTRNDARVVLSTATPAAASGADWNAVADWTAPTEGPCMRTTRWAINAGYLVPMVQAFVRVNLDLSKVYQASENISDGDEDGNEKESVLFDLLSDRGEREGAEFAKGIVEVIGDRRAIAYCPPRRPGRTDSPAQSLAAWIQATQTITAEAFWGGRQGVSDAIGRFVNYGDPQVFTNCALAREALNAPKVSAVVLCRRVPQWLWLMQMVGRGLRPHPSVIERLNQWDGEEYAAERRKTIRESEKPNCLIVDLIGIDNQVLQASAIEVLYEGQPSEVIGEMKSIAGRRCAGNGNHVRVDTALVADAQAQIAQRQKTQLDDMIRRRAMAGELHADVSVSYDGAAAISKTPSAKHSATDEEKASYLVWSDYPTQKALQYANEMTREQLRGATQAARTKRKKEGRYGDWGRAKRAFPAWVPKFEQDRRRTS